MFKLLISDNQLMLIQIMNLHTFMFMLVANQCRSVENAFAYP